MQRVILLLITCMLASCSNPNTSRLDQPTSDIQTPSKLHLKPGFYAIGDPNTDVLWRYTQTADISLSLSGHNGLSLANPQRHKLSISDLRTEARKLPQTILADIMLEKNFFDTDLHKEIVAVLQEEGFREIITTRGHSGGTILEDYRVTSVQSD